MGLGGGFILLLYLIFFGDSEQLSSQGQNLVFFIPVIAASLIFHFKNKLIDLKSALICGGVGACFVYFGYLLASALESDLLKKIFACFIIVAGLKDLIFKPKPKKTE